MNVSVCKKVTEGQVLHDPEVLEEGL